MPYRDKLPVVELELATPCTARWDTMRGDDRVRHCGSCDKRVYDLATLELAEIEALIQANEGTICARYFQRHDGSVIVRDCTRDLRIRMSPQQIAFWIMVILAGIATLTAIAIGCAQGGGFTGSVGAAS